MKGSLQRDGLHVCDRLCETCVFRPGNLMFLMPGRLRGMVRDALANDSFIPCHKTLDGQQAVCRGFYDRHARDTLGCRLGAIVGIVESNPDTVAVPLPSCANDPKDGEPPHED